MAITQVGSTTNTGNSTDVTSRAPAVPTGAAVNDVAFVFLDLWLSNPTVTPPSGFNLLFSVTGGTGVAVKCYWKRLTAADTGTYSFTWTGTNWTTASCTMLRGVKSSGDPVGANFNTAFVTSATFPSTSVNPGYIPGLLWHGYNDTGGSHTPPTSPAGFTETVEVDCATDAIHLPSSGTSFTVTGATVSASSPIMSALVAVEAEPAGPPAEAAANSSAMNLMGKAYY